MVFRNKEQEKDHLGREDYLVNRSTPKFRQQAYYRDRWLEHVVGEMTKRVMLITISSNFKILEVQKF